MHNFYTYALAQIRHGYTNRWKVVYCRDNSYTLSILTALQRYNLIENFFVDYNEKNINKRCNIYLKYKFGQPILSSLNVISKPGSIRPVTKLQLYKLLRRSNNTLYFLNTPNGITAYNYSDIYVLNLKKQVFTGFLLFKVEIW